MRYPLRIASLAAPLLLLGCPTESKLRSSPETQPASPTAEGAFARRLTPAELAERKKLLPPQVFHITQEEGTEPPFRNAYWNNHDPGIYVDVVSGEPLFSSHEKFDSGTGWPSFWAPLEKANIQTRQDGALGMSRVEVHSRVGGSHLGHVFDDGPAPTHLRYCMDSASLRFVPAERLVAEGYGEYTKLFPDLKLAPPSAVPAAAPSGVPTAAPSGAPTAAPSGASPAAPSGASPSAPAAAPTAAPATAPTSPAK